MALGDDLVTDGCIEWAVHVVQQQLARVAVVEPADRKRRQLGQDLVADARSRGEHERDTLGEEPPGDETQNLRRCMIEPLRVVDDAEERLLLGDLSEQRQRREPHQQTVGCRTGAPPEHRRERVALRAGKPFEVVQHRRAKLMEPAVGELQLRLDADGRRSVPVGAAVGQIAE